MAVLSARELARSFQHRFGEAPTAQLRFALTLSDPATTQQEMINYVGISTARFILSTHTCGALREQSLRMIPICGTLRSFTATPCQSVGT